MTSEEQRMDRLMHTLALLINMTEDELRHVEMALQIARQINQQSQEKVSGI